MHSGNTVCISKRAFFLKQRSLVAWSKYRENESWHLRFAGMGTEWDGLLILFCTMHPLIPERLGC